MMVKEAEPTIATTAAKNTSRAVRPSFLPASLYLGMFSWGALGVPKFTFILFPFYWEGNALLGPFYCCIPAGVLLACRALPVYHIRVQKGKDAPWRFSGDFAPKNRLLVTYCPALILLYALLCSRMLLFSVKMGASATPV